MVYQHIFNIILKKFLIYFKYGIYLCKNYTKGIPYKVIENIKGTTYEIRR